MAARVDPEGRKGQLKCWNTVETLTTLATRAARQRGSAPNRRASVLRDVQVEEKQCVLTILLVSHTYVDAISCGEEFSYALQHAQHRPKAIPLFVDDSTLNEVNEGQHACWVANAGQASWAAEHIGARWPRA